MKLFHFIRQEDIMHDDYFEFTVVASSPQQAWKLVKHYVETDAFDGDFPEYYFDDDISNWRIEEIKLDNSQVIQSSILYG